MSKVIRTRKACAAVPVLVLFLCGIACKPTETSAPPAPIVSELEDARWIEPRLTSAKAWAGCHRTQQQNRMLDQIDCGAPHVSPAGGSLSNEECQLRAATHGDA